MKDVFPRSVWVISREYAGIAEAGGVKNVSCSLCEGLAAKGVEVTLLIPRYACTDFSSVSGYKPNLIPPQRINVSNASYLVNFDGGLTNGGVKVVFVSHQVFSDKTGVYTYTADDEAINSEQKRGKGFSDELLLDILFQKAVVAFGAESNQLPDIIHCQDAATAFVPALFHFSPSIAKDNKSKFVVTIHNAGPGYHHNIPSLEQAESLTSIPVDFLRSCLNYDTVEPFVAAASFASITTVSPWYAEELMDSSNDDDTAGLSSLFTKKNFSITGITNGIDCDKYDPKDTEVSQLPYAFDPASGELSGKYKNREFFLREYAGLSAKSRNHSAGLLRYGSLKDCRKRTVFLGYHGRIVRQKGIDVLASAANILLSERNDVRFIIVGQGEPDLEASLAELAAKHEGKCVFFQGYDRSLARLATAVSDFIVLPSKFEPCGLEDFIAQLYGTIPVAHATGGLNKIVDNKTGFLYQDNTPDELHALLDRLCSKMIQEPDCFGGIVRHAADYVNKNYSWLSVIENKYLPFYRNI